MLIHEISQSECVRVLSKASFAKLACVHENQPYLVPVYLAYHQSATGQACLYGFTTFGQKVAWMRANPLVCVEVDEVTAYDQWVSIIAIGRYEELPESAMDDAAQGRKPEQSETCNRECGNEAWQALKVRPNWQEPGSTAWAARAHCDGFNRLIPIYYKILIESVTGHEATREAKTAT
jgi:nitroimidazol reductase NimA-like FMN-containing flavoprotein (pyridoxamine 5'-phosphate oxidase superfamily)